MSKNPYKLKNGLSKEEVALVQGASKTLVFNNWQIEKGELNSKPWPHIFSLIEESSATRLSFYSNNAVINLNLYLSPKFPNLVQLSLSCNKIQSIQALACLSAPNLIDIMLMANKITNVRSIRKAFFPRLREINISGNPILDPSPLTHLPSKIIDEIHLQRWPNLPMIGETKRWALKLHPSSGRLKELSMKSYSRRAEFHIDAVLMARYPCFKNT